MLRNYLTIVWRNMSRQPAHTFLNLSCLTIGIAAVLFILLYLDFEVNYDRFHEKSDQIYRIETNVIETHSKKIDVEWEGTPAMLGAYMKKDFPEVESYVRFYRFFLNESIPLEFEGKVINEENVDVVNASVLDVFSFDFVYGDSKTALTGPNKIILTESLAKKIFGDTNPIGKILKSNLVHMLPDVDPEYALMVSGVYRDWPENSYLDFNALISAESDPQLASYHFGRFSYYTYALLLPEVDSEKLAPKLSAIYDQYLDPNIEPVMKSAIHELVPLTQIHMNQTGGFTYVYIFVAIGFLLLLIAIISYVNLVTAQASKRALEIGVRKVMGSSREQLTIQFLSESLIFSFLTLTFAVSLVRMLVIPFNELLNLELDAQVLWQPHMLLGMLGIFLVLGIFGGSYPAFFLSSFQPVAIMKGKFSHGVPLRKMLVTVQFVVVIFVLASTGMIYDQLQFLRQKDLGFDQDQVVRLSFASEEDTEKIDVFREKLKQSPLISSVGTSSFLPGIGMPRRPLSADDSSNRESQFVHFGRVDYDYFETMNIQIKAGRNFSKEYTNDATQHIIVNETMARKFGLENPVGEHVRYGDKNNPNSVEIIGVVKDFHQSNLYDEIGPQMFLLSPNSNLIAVKINDDITNGINHIEKSWNELFPNTAFTYNFLDEDIDNGYALDQIRGKIFLLFSGLTIFITFMGLFGLVAYMARQRVKEIGIRKILGASIWSIVQLISKDFLWLVCLAALPAFGIAWYFMNEWLQDFAYRTDMNYVVFGMALLFTLGLTFMVTALHAIQTSRMNPVESLKYE